MQKRSARLLALSIGLAITAGILLLVVCTRERTLKPLPKGREPIEVWDAASLPITPQLAVQEADLLEAVFRYQIEHNTSGIPPAGSTESVYISLGEDKDPPTDVLARFKNQVPSVKPVSAAGNLDAMPPVGDRIVFRATRIKRIDDDTVEIEGGYHCGGRCAAGGTYRLQRKVGTWTVVSDVMHWIS